MIHPDLHKWQVAKQAALAIAANMKAEIVQTPDGKTKRVILGKRIVDCMSWYAAYCFLHRIRLDQLNGKGPDPPAPAPPAKQEIPWAIVLD